MKKKTFRLLPRASTSLEEAMQCWSMKLIEERANLNNHSIHLTPLVSPLEFSLPKGIDWCFADQWGNFFLGTKTNDIVTVMA